MPKKYIVVQGDSLHSIALAHGFKSWKVIHEFVDNAKLFETRKPALLYPGDELWIPDKVETPRPVVTGRAHTFVTATPKCFHLRIQVIDEEHQPLAGRSFELSLRDSQDTESMRMVEQATDCDGMIDVEVLPTASMGDLWLEGKPSQDGLTYPAYECQLNIGYLDPCSEVTGMKQRLFNLGYFFGRVNEPTIDTELRRALAWFRLDHGIPVDAGEKTLTAYVANTDALRKLLEKHDNLCKDIVLQSSEVQAEGVMLDEISGVAASTQRFPTHPISPIYEPGPVRNTIRVYTAVEVVFDAHLHIQSNNCAPLPLARGLAVDALPKVGPKTALALNQFLPPLAIGAIAGSVVLRIVTQGVLSLLTREQINRITKNIKPEFGEIGEKSTNEIADRIVAENAETMHLYDYGVRERIRRSLGMMAPIIVLPMDMDFAHFEGYFGEPVYYTRSTRISYQSRYDPMPMPMPMPTPMPMPISIDLDPDPPRLYDFEKKRRYTQEELAAAEVRQAERVEELRKSGFVVTVQGSGGYRGNEGHHVYYLKSAKGTPASGQVHWLDRNEFNIYEDFIEQLALTEMSSVQHPWRIVPLFHYDPRRWQLPRLGFEFDSNVGHDSLGPWDFPFSKIATAEKAGCYIGVKMYTSMGYKPSQYKDADMPLPWMAHFFAECMRARIPILSHCTPEGAYTHERHLYYDEPWSKAGRIERFKQDFVSPAAWKPVLEDFPGLKLILAHFTGGDKGMAWHSLRESLCARVGDDPWARELSTEALRGCMSPEIMRDSPWLVSMIELIEENADVYVDISYLDVEVIKAEFAMVLLAHPKIVHRINFGTDWYMTQVSKSLKGYESHVERAKKALDAIDRRHFSDEPISLWTRFSHDNPMRCFAIKDIAENYSIGLKAKNAELHQQMAGWPKSKHDAEIDRQLALIKKSRRLHE